MTKDEEILAAILQERGYIVTRCYERRRIGQRLEPLARSNGAGGTDFLETRQPFIVIAETDEADYLKQVPIIERFGYVSLKFDGGNRFYRITTD